MKKGQESQALLNGMMIYHQNLPARQVRSHSHPEAHLFIPLRGEVKVHYKTESWRVPPGKMLYLTGGITHSFESSELQGERIIVKLNSNKKTNKLLPASNLIKELLFYILRAPTSKNAKKSASLVKEILYEQLREQTFDVTQFHSLAKDERVVKALEVIDSHLSYDLATVASTVGCSIKTLSRLFSADLNLTPKQVQTSLRVYHAQELLRKGGMNITEIAYEVGFNSLSAFNKNYRDLTGISPSLERG